MHAHALRYTPGCLYAPAYEHASPANSGYGPKYAGTCEALDVQRYLQMYAEHPICAYAC
jgi:hypothetical protein